MSLVPARADVWPLTRDSGFGTLQPQADTVACSLSVQADMRAFGRDSGFGTQKTVIPAAGGSAYRAESAAVGIFFGFYPARENPRASTPLRRCGTNDAQ